MRNLMLACAAALLATGAHAGGGSDTSYGVDDCGKKQNRAILAGGTFTCCSDHANDFVLGYEYTVTRGSSDDNVNYTAGTLLRTSARPAFCCRRPSSTDVESPPPDLLLLLLLLLLLPLVSVRLFACSQRPSCKVTAFGETYTKSICDISSGACDGYACSYSSTNRCDTGRQDLSDNTDNSTAMCFTAKCNNDAADGACEGMQIEFEIATRLPEAQALNCPTCSLENTYGSCGALSKAKSGAKKSTQDS